MHQFCRLLVVHEFLHDGVPHDRAAELHRDISEVADSAGAVSNLNRDIRIIARQDGVDELTVMTDLGLEGDISIRHLHVKLRVGSGETAAADLDPSVVSVYLYSLPLPIEGLFRYDYAVVITVGEMVIVAVSRRNNLDRAAAVLSDSPLGDVEHMGTPVGHKTAAGHLVPAPCTP